MVNKDGIGNGKVHRPIRSFVLRKGRLTSAQQTALTELWPHYGIECRPEALDFARLFGRKADTIIDIGFGNGESTWRMAAGEPDKNFIGIEVHEPGVGHCLLKADASGVRNLRIIMHDAVEVLAHQIPSGSLARLNLYFPDPWPKKRHHKRRLVQPQFVELLARRMSAGAILHIATDWAPYAAQMRDVLAGSPDFENLSPTGDFSPRPEWRPPSRYEQRGERLGHDVFDLVCRRVVESGAN